MSKASHTHTHTPIPSMPSSLFTLIDAWERNGRGRFGEDGVLARNLAFISPFHRSFPDLLY